MSFKIGDKVTWRSQSGGDWKRKTGKRKHQHLVAERMLAIAKEIITRAIKHDESKFSDIECESYVEPVYALNTENVEFGSNRYEKLTSQMGKGWDHHKTVNDHHVEFFETYSFQTLNDPIKAMNMFAILEMLSDWIAAAKRKGNNPGLALDYLIKEYPMDEQLQAIIRNTLAMIERLG